MKNARATAELLKDTLDVIFALAESYGLPPKIANGLLEATRRYIEEEKQRTRMTEQEKIKATQRLNLWAEAIERGEACVNCEFCLITGRCALDQATNRQPHNAIKNWCSAYEPTNWND